MNDRPDRRRRDGRGVSGARHDAGPQRRDQGAPRSVADDPERLARFQREAQVLASLNHPNIAADHGLEEAAARTALVMELVEGDDPRERIAAGRSRSPRRSRSRGRSPRPRSRARAGHHPPRSQAGQHQGPSRRHGEGAGLRPGESDGPRSAQVARASSHSPTITSPAMTQRA